MFQHQLMFYNLFHNISYVLLLRYLILVNYFLYIQNLLLLLYRLLMIFLHNIQNLLRLLMFHFFLNQINYLLPLFEFLQLLLMYFHLCFHLLSGFILSKRTTVNGSV